MATTNASPFSPEEFARYSRHILIPEFGLEAQLKLRDARVLVVGSGGLGSPVLLYLAAAGVGHIGIVDFDTVDDSNLQRQVLFTTADVGQSKARRAAERIRALNPHIRVEIHETRLDSANAREIVRQYDVVADGTDNFPTRYLVNDACVLEGKTNVYASIFQFEGQVSVFNFPTPDGGRGPNYRDLFPEPPPPGLVPSCAEGGVLGVLPGIIGSMQALEVIKVLTGVGEPLAGRLFLFDASSFQTRTLNVRKQPGTRVEALIDYQIFCGVGLAEEQPVEELPVAEYAAWRASGKPHQLIDVREPHEYAIAHLDGLLLPLGQLADHQDQLARDLPIVLHCRSGVRSAKAIRALREQGWEGELYNLSGGLLAWAKEQDPSMTVY